MNKENYEISAKKIDALVPYAKNSRTHSPEQIEKIAASIREFGFTNPVLIDADGGIIAGHGRVAAAKFLGMESVPCIILDHLTDAQKRAYIIADNRLALDAGWDEETLSTELRELLAQEFDLGLTGFDADEILALINDSENPAQSGAGSLAEKFLIPPFSVLNAREGWWQDRKRAWIDLGIKSELGRGGDGNMEHSATGNAPPNACPGGSLMPAADYARTKARGDGKGRFIRGAS